MAARKPTYNELAELIR
jgi:transposase